MVLKSKQMLVAPPRLDRVHVEVLTEPTSKDSPNTSEGPITLRSMRRRAQTVPDYPELLRCEPFESDPRFGRRYRQCLDAKIPIGFTRISGERIQGGFRRHPDAPLIRSPEPSSENVSFLRRRIREGRRLHVFLYKSPTRSDREFVCSDDLETLEAYRQENIALIPAAIMDPQQAMLEHAALVCRHLPRVQDRPMACECWMLPARPHVSSLLGDRRDSLAADEALTRLRSGLESALEKLKTFHSAGPGGSSVLHYHESLASALVRATRFVLSIENAISGGGDEAAAVSVRAVYELSLTTYLDWLNPELVGSYFQLSASSSPQMRKKAQDIICAQYARDGWHPDDVRAWRKSSDMMFRVAEQPKEKARLNPFAALHDRIYPRLCHEAHQDFKAAAPFLGALSSSPGTFVRPDADNNVRFFIQVLDLAVSNIVTSVLSDVNAVLGSQDAA